MALQNYRSLNVWKRAMELVITAYEVCKKLPQEERFGLSSQIQRAAVSIPANIAEGYGRTHRGDYLRHLSMAMGSLSELETLLILIVKLKAVGRNDVVKGWGISQEVGKMLRKLISSLK